MAMGFSESLREFKRLTMNLKKTLIEKMALTDFSFNDLKQKTLHVMRACETDRIKQKDALLRLVQEPMKASFELENKECLLGALIFLQTTLENEFSLLKKIKGLKESFKGRIYTSFSSSVSSMARSFSQGSKQSGAEHSRLYQSLGQIIALSEIDVYTQLNALKRFKEVMEEKLPCGQKRFEVYEHFGEKEFLKTLNVAIETIASQCVYFHAIDFLQGIVSLIPEEQEAQSPLEYFMMLYGAYLLIMNECDLKFHLLMQERSQALSPEFTNILQEILDKLLEDVPSLEKKIKSVELFAHFTKLIFPLSIEMRCFFGTEVLEDKIKQLLLFYKIDKSSAKARLEFEFIGGVCRPPESRARPRTRGDDGPQEETSSGFTVLSSF